MAIRVINNALPVFLSCIIFYWGAFSPDFLLLLFFISMMRKYHFQKNLDFWLKNHFFFASFGIPFKQIKSHEFYLENKNRKKLIKILQIELKTSIFVVWGTCTP